MIKVILKPEQLALEGFQLFCLAALGSSLPPPSGDSTRQFVRSTSRGQQTRMIITKGD